MGHLIEMQGDLFTSTAPAIGHGVNTVGAMGAGIAKTFRDKNPEMYEAYRQQCKDGLLKPGGLMVWAPQDGSKVIYNIASQHYPGANAQIHLLGTGLFYALMDAERRGFDRIAIPRIGAGIGGLDWAAVESVVRGQVEKPNVDIEVWSL